MSESKERYSDMGRTIGGTLMDKVHASKVLMVGAGGIGCELVKNLVMSGFRDIVMIDLDTIDVSNLNRQFLFRKEHVGKSKSQVARESVLKMNPHVKIVAHHGNIKDPQFGAEFFKTFTIVMNALDNLDARRHVNRMCLSAGVTLLESGTQGYLGQATTLAFGAPVEHKTECFECLPHPEPKTYAVCTLRNTPDKPHHCIVWSEMIFSTFFGEDDEDNPMKDLKIAIAADYTVADVDAYARTVFTALYNTEIVKQLEAKERWKNRAPPTPLDMAELLQEDTALPGDQEVPSVAASARAFIDTIVRLMMERRELVGTMSFDKDDELALDFITASSNLRMHVYGIAMHSRFKIKGIAGNIVHAIATTNAIAAGQLVIEAFKVLDGRWTDCCTTWIKRNGPKVISPQSLEPPSTACIVCGKARITLRADTSKLTLKDLYTRVLVKALGMLEPSIDVLSKNKCLGYADDFEPSQLAQPLAHYEVVDGALLALDDDDQNFKVTMIVEHQVLDEDTCPDGFLLVGSVSASAPEPEASPAPSASAADREVMTIDEDEPQPAFRSGKRGLPEASDATGPAVKRAKVQEAPAAADDDDDLIVLD